MAKYTVDFSDVPSDKMENGVYEAVVNKIEMRESKSSEHPYLNWEFEIVEGESIGRKVYMMTSLSPKALFRLKQTFEVCGLDADSVTDMDVDDATHELLFPDFIQMPVTIKVKNENYQGRDIPKVEQITESHRPFTASGAVLGEEVEFADPDDETPEDDDDDSDYEDEPEDDEDEDEESDESEEGEPEFES